MSTTIQMRRDTAANWTSANPILASGEWGKETDTGKGKWGDGTTAWVDLEYSVGPDLAALVEDALFDANTILKADTDNTPVALTVGASTFVGRKATGGISAMSVAEAGALLSGTFVSLGPPASGDATGATDTAALTAAIAALITTAQPGAAKLLLQAGKYYVNDTIQFTNLYSPCLAGQGDRATFIQPTTGLASKPVVQFTDCRSWHVDDIHIAGVPSGTVAECAIKSYRSAASPGGGLLNQYSGTKNVFLGADGFVGLGIGIKYAASGSSADGNNDQGLFIDTDIIGFSDVAYEFGHQNSLLHRIVAGTVSVGPTVVRCKGGSFDMTGTVVTAITGYAFDFQAAPYSGAYKHKSTIRCEIESQSQLLNIDSAAAAVWVDFIGTGQVNSPVGGATMVNVQGASAVVQFIGCNFNFGQPACVATFTDATSQARFLGNGGLGFSTISYNGRLTLRDNHHIAGTVTLTNLGSGKLYGPDGDDGGGFKTGDGRPWLIDIDPTMTAVNQSGWNTITVDALSIGNGRKDSGSSITDYLEFDVLLSEGTWTVEMLLAQVTNGGQINVLIDGATASSFGGSADFVEGYAASTARNVRASITGIVLNSTKKRRVKLATSSKNASSSAYQGLLGKLQFKRTA